MVDRLATLQSFGCGENPQPAEDYQFWVRQVAQARWFSSDVASLPWWVTAKDHEEVADSDRHPSATTFDGHSLAEERPELEIAEAFAAQY